MLILISSQGHCLQLALASSEVFTDQLLPFYPWRNLTGFQQNLQIQWMYDSLFKTLILCNPASVQGEVRRKINCISLYFCSLFFFFTILYLHHLKSSTDICLALPRRTLQLKDAEFSPALSAEMTRYQMSGVLHPLTPVFFFFFLFPILLATTEKVDSNQIGWGR